MGRAWKRWILVPINSAAVRAPTISARQLVCRDDPTSSVVINAYRRALDDGAILRLRAEQSLPDARRAVTSSCVISAPSNPSPASGAMTTSPTVSLPESRTSNSIVAVPTVR